MDAVGEDMQVLGVRVEDTENILKQWFTVATPKKGQAKWEKI